MLRGAQKAVARIYVELLRKIQADTISLHLTLKTTQSLLKVSQVQKNIKRK